MRIEAWGGVDHFLHARILGIEDAQGVGMKAATGILVEKIVMPFKILDQGGPVRLPLRARAQGIDLKPHPGEPEVGPQALGHDDELGVHIRTGEAKSFDVNLVELAIASALRALMTKHRAD